jgi:hypothetical protein
MGSSDPHQLRRLHRARSRPEAPRLSGGTKLGTPPSAPGADPGWGPALRTLAPWLALMRASRRPPPTASARCGSLSDCGQPPLVLLCLLPHHSMGCRGRGVDALDRDHLRCVTLVAVLWIQHRPLGQGVPRDPGRSVARHTGRLISNPDVHQHRGRRDLCADRCGLALRLREPVGIDPWPRPGADRRWLSAARPPKHRERAGAGQRPGIPPVAHRGIDEAIPHPR